MGMAVADAIGNPLEFLVGSRGVDMPSEFDNAWNSNKVIHVSDDTQMTMFLMEALLADTWGSGKHIKRWYTTQTTRGPLHEYMGLLKYREMYRVEAPGHTCMTSAKALVAGELVDNNSKGNGTTMRCLPIAYWCAKECLPERVLMEMLAVETQFTHKHHVATTATQALGTLYHLLLLGISWESAVSRIAKKFPEFEDMTSSNWDDVSHLGGWVADEALIMAVVANNCADNYRDIIKLAACIDGDSDTVAGIAGALSGLRGHVVEHRMKMRLDVGYILSELAYHLATSTPYK
jgi:ADP-ribosylglycohydrolase